MASILRVNTLTDASSNNSVPMATVASGSLKTWANVKGTDTFTLRDSFNVSSATDTATGQPTITINNDMANNDYSVSGTQGGTNGTDELRVPVNGGDFATGSYAYSTVNTGVALVDAPYSCTQVAGDLA